MAWTTSSEQSINRPVRSDYWGRKSEELRFFTREVGVFPGHQGLVVWLLGGTRCKWVLPERPNIFLSLQSSTDSFETHPRETQTTYLV